MQQQPDVTAPKKTWRTPETESAPMLNVSKTFKVFKNEVVLLNYFFLTL